MIRRKKYLYSALKIQLTWSVALAWLCVYVYSLATRYTNTLFRWWKLNVACDDATTMRCIIMELMEFESACHIFIHKQPNAYCTTWNAWKMVYLNVAEYRQMKHMHESPFINSFLLWKNVPCRFYVDKT